MTTLPLVLVVDDDEDVRTFIKELLEEEGYAVATAGNGREAVDFTTSSPREPSCVLLDLMMPVMNGWDVMEHWEREGRLPRLQVVIFTAAVNAKGPPGARTYLRKPTDSTQLLDTIKACCSHAA